MLEVNLSFVALLYALICYVGVAWGLYVEVNFVRCPAFSDPMDVHFTTRIVYIYYVLLDGDYSRTRFKYRCLSVFF